MFTISRYFTLKRPFPLSMVGLANIKREAAHDTRCPLRGPSTKNWNVLHAHPHAFRPFLLLALLVQVAKVASGMRSGMASSEKELFDS